LAQAILAILSQVVSSSKLQRRSASKCCKIFLATMHDTALFLLIAAVAGSAGAVELTKETWDAAVSGKQIFVKFLAPW